MLNTLSRQMTTLNKYITHDYEPYVCTVKFLRCIKRTTAMFVMLGLCISINGCANKITGNPENIKIKPNNKLVFGKIDVYNKEYKKEEVELTGKKIRVCFDVNDTVTGKIKSHECGYIKVTPSKMRSEDKPYYGYVMLSLPPGNATLKYIKVYDYYDDHDYLSFDFPNNLTFKVAETSNATYFGNISFHIIQNVPFIPAKNAKSYFPKLSISINNEGDKVLKNLHSLPEDLTKNYTPSTVQVEKSKFTIRYGSYSNNRGYSTKRTKRRRYKRRK